MGNEREQFLIWFDFFFGQQISIDVSNIENAPPHPPPHPPKKKFTYKI